MQTAHKRGAEKNRHKEHPQCPQAQQIPHPGMSLNYAKCIYSGKYKGKEIMNLVTDQTGRGQKKQNTIQLPYQGRKQK